jgi:nitrate reductase assembly molybdenum cofactor insertion protein NarJ
MASNAVPPTLLRPLAVLLRQPDDAFRETVTGLCDAPLPLEAAQQLGKFLERLRDLTTDELQELFAQTFPQAPPADGAPGAEPEAADGTPGERRPASEAAAQAGEAARPAPPTGAGQSLVNRIAAGLEAMAASASSTDRAREAGKVLVPLRELVDALGRARNPYVHAMTALYLVVAAFRGTPVDPARAAAGAG